MTEGISLAEFNRLQKTRVLRRPKPRDPSEGEEELARQLKIAGIPFEREVMFHHTRRWRFDFLLTGTKIAIEVEGGIWNNGRHSRGKGFEEDCLKYNEAAMENWKVLRFSTGQVKSGVAMKFIQRIKCLKPV